MKVLDFLQVDCVVLDLQSPTKKDVLSDLCNLLVEKGKLKESAPVIEALMKREKLGSTGIGQGVAIPHAKTELVSGCVGAVGIIRRGINFEALDGEPVYIIFLLLASPESAGEHLKALARISRLLKDKFFRQSLREAKSVEDVKRIIEEEDQY